MVKSGTGRVKAVELRLQQTVDQNISSGCICSKSTANSPSQVVAASPFVTPAQARVQPTDGRAPWSSCKRTKPERAKTGSRSAPSLRRDDRTCARCNIRNSMKIAMAAVNRRRGFPLVPHQPAADPRSDETGRVNGSIGPAPPAQVDLDRLGDAAPVGRVRGDDDLGRTATRR
jgi:hypothetical protein